MTDVPVADGVLDTLGMFEVTAGLPEQVGAAVGAAHGLDGLPEREYVENVVVLGMGGSGLAGDVMVAVAGPFVPVPITVVKSYDLPDFVGRGSLVFAISFSGNTEETVEAAGEAANAGASLVAVTAGGELGRLAEEWGAPVVPVPTTIPQPRAGIGAMAIPPLVVLGGHRVVPGRGHVGGPGGGPAQVPPGPVGPAREQRRGGGPAASAAPFPSSTGPRPSGPPATVRWKAQVNENAKAPAFAAVYPELCHNEIAGWGQHGDVTRQIITLINLRHDAEHPSWPGASPSSRMCFGRS